MSDEEKGGPGAAWHSLGDFIRSQRELANLSMRQLAEIAKISNPYLSQVERGLYKPSADVLKNIANALHMSAETMYAQAGLLDDSPEPGRKPPWGRARREARPAAHRRPKRNDYPDLSELHRPRVGKRQPSRPEPAAYVVILSGVEEGLTSTARAWYT